MEWLTYVCKFSCIFLNRFCIFVPHKRGPECSKVADGNRVFTVAALSSLDGRSQKQETILNDPLAYHQLIKTNEETEFNEGRT